MGERTNQSQQALWGDDILPDMNRVLQDCKGYATTPGWVVMYRSVINAFHSFENLSTIELGCGLGKVSILFSILGAHITLLDYSDKQLAAARFVHTRFNTGSRMIQGNLLELPKELEARYDVAMSFGTAEHFFGDDRQRVFDSHAKVLRPGGLALIWVPNSCGLLFHLGRAVRKTLGRSMCSVDEKSFTRGELGERARDAGLTDIQVKGAESLGEDFCHFIVDLPRILKMKKTKTVFSEASIARETLKQCMSNNKKEVRLWNDLFSYPLLLLGRKG